ncbi:MAG TPA: YbhB/YbcL family Raf kinase inhibitor-like protein, partial [Gammaproteobacteria bacterium]|nr:YbhB/YbcL family Raf kinase inhibitor-like protein [Gammaproteobacteria bacterium]
MGFALSNMQLTSEAFETGGTIPSKYTGEGTDVSPPLMWSA